MFCHLTRINEILLMYHMLDIDKVDVKSNNVSNSLPHLLKFYAIKTN